jgi:serine phosphatase RsbU (regulator of sigma subunit)
MRTILFFFCFLFTAAYTVAGNAIDSLEAKLKTAQGHDKAIILTQLSKRYSSKDPDHALKLAQEAVALANKIKDTEAQLAANLQLGELYQDFSEHEKANTSFLEALRISEATGNVKGIGRAKMEIGSMHGEMRKTDLSLKNYYEAMPYLEKAGDKKLLGDLYNFMGTAYKNKDSFDSSLHYHNKALAIRIELKDKRGMSYSYNNIGLVYNKQENYPKALDYLRMSLAIKDSLGDKKGGAGSRINIATIYNTLGNYDEALEYALRGIELAEEAKAREFKKVGYQTVAESYSQKGNYKDAFIYLEKYAQLKDSIYDETSVQSIAELQTKYDTEKKERAIDLLNKEKEVQSLALKKNQYMIYGISAGCILLLVLAAVIYGSYNQKKKAHALLELQNVQIAEKNKEITDSIRYAKRIQEALLPMEEDIYRNFSDAFILYKPKDIVSGDFYWFSRKGELCILAVADCTGHGVPGAMMSMMGHNLMNQIVNDENVTSPGHALKMLDQRINRALNNTTDQNENRDGMDIAFCVIETNTQRLHFAGAFRPLLLVRNNSLIECNASKFAIGGRQRQDKVFENNIIQLSKGDTIYMFSDGFADQFGGEKGKKFKYSQFKEVLMSIHSRPMKGQQAALDKIFEDWKGHLEQVDDILVVGVRI